MPGKKACSCRTVINSKLISGQWPVWADDPLHSVWPYVGSYIRACYSVWSCGSPPRALKGGYSPWFWDCPPAVTWSTDCLWSSAIWKMPLCLQLFSLFSKKFQVEEFIRCRTGGTRTEREGVRGSQSSSSNRNDGLTPAALSRDSYKRQVLVVG